MNKLFCLVAAAAALLAAEQLEFEWTTVRPVGTNDLVSFTNSDVGDRYFSFNILTNVTTNWTTKEIVTGSHSWDGLLTWRYKGARQDGIVLTNRVLKVIHENATNWLTVAVVGSNKLSRIVDADGAADYLQQEK